MSKVQSVEHYSSNVVLDDMSLLISIGNTSLANSYATTAQLASEGFSISSNQYLSGSTLIAANGAPIDPKGLNFELNVDAVHYGAAVGAYAVLEELGFGFLHPLDTILPTSIQLKSTNFSRTEAPYWEKRTWHIHTQHPLEFTEVLNGWDIPMFGSSDAVCRVQYCESWDSMFGTLPGLFEWLVANRQNRVEVLLLGNDKWDHYRDLTTGQLRQDRLRQITTLAHQYGVLMGADIPLANLQQHGWAMVSTRDDMAKQTQDIQDRVDWAFHAGYDFISTESGLSEFTKPSCDLMLELFNIFTNYIHDVWKREAVTKVHCSTDQICKETLEDGSYKYPDPRNKSQPINFNFLPTYAAAALGVMPHTIQAYSFDDPTAGAYGNSNFSYVSDYMTFEAAQGRRDVLYYGETAYW